MENAESSGFDDDDDNDEAWEMAVDEFTMVAGRVPELA